jgi:hypothetical protein
LEHYGRQDPSGGATTADVEGEGCSEDDASDGEEDNVAAEKRRPDETLLKYAARVSVILGQDREKYGVLDVTVGTTNGWEKVEILIDENGEDLDKKSDELEARFSDCKVFYG